MVFIRYYFDSLNPSAIAQQMLLQAMVKKKRHIWFFICGIGTANLIMGLAIYYGIATWVSKFLTKIVNAYPLYVYGAAAIDGDMQEENIRFTGRSTPKGRKNRSYQRF